MGLWVWQSYARNLRILLLDSIPAFVSCLADRPQRAHSWLAIVEPQSLTRYRSWFNNFGRVIKLQIKEYKNFYPSLK